MGHIYVKEGIEKGIHYWAGYAINIIKGHHELQKTVADTVYRACDPVVSGMDHLLF